MSSCLCEVCGLRNFAYTCPRCSTVYCSQLCYKNHSPSCCDALNSEVFTNALKSEKPTSVEVSEFVENLNTLRKKLDQCDSEWLEIENELLKTSTAAEEGTSSKKVTSGLLQVERDPEINESRFYELLKKVHNGTLRIEDLSDSEIEEFEKSIMEGRETQSLTIPWWHRTRGAHALLSRVTGASLNTVDILEDCDNVEIDGVIERTDHLCCSESHKASRTVIHWLLPLTLVYYLVWDSETSMNLGELTTLMVPELKKKTIVPPTSIETTIRMLEYRLQPLSNQLALVFPDKEECFQNVALLCSSKKSLLKVLNAIRDAPLPQGGQRHHLLNRIDFFISFVLYHCTEESDDDSGLVVSSEAVLQVSLSKLAEQIWGETSSATRPPVIQELPDT